MKAYGYFVAWSATRRETDARIFPTQPEANAWTFAESNRDGVVASGFRRIPRTWTFRGALDWATNRANAALEAVSASEGI